MAPSNPQVSCVAAEAEKRISSNVRFGSKIDIAMDQLNVRFTPNSGHRLSRP